MAKRTFSNELRERIRELENKIETLQRDNEALRSNEKRLLEMLDQMPAIVCEYDTTGKLTYVNAFGRVVAGIAPVAFEQGMYISDLFSGGGDDADRQKKRMKRLLAGEVLDPTEFGILRRDGSTVDIRVITAAIVENGAIVGGRTSAVLIGEIKKMEKALTESEKRRQGIIENAVVGVYRVTQEGRFLLINPALARILGYPSPEAFLATGNTIAQLYVDPEDRPAVLREMNSKGFIEKAEVLFQHRSGGTVWISLSGRVEKDPIHGIVYEGFIQDITEQKQTQQALKESEENYRKLFDDAQIGMARTRIEDGKILEVNQNGAEIFGYPSREACLDDFVFSDIYVYPEERRQVVEILNEKGEIHNREVLLVRKNGSQFWIRFSARLYPEKGYIEGVLTDITEERKAVEALKESEERYRTLFDNAQVGIFRSRIEDGVIIEANQRLVEIAGYDSIGEFIGKYKVSDHYVDKKTRDRYLKILLEQGEVHNYEALMAREDGSQFWIRFSARIYPDKGFIEGALTDITEERKTVDALRESEERYRNLFDNAQVGISRSRIEDGMIVECNQRAAEIYGYESREECIDDYRASDHYLDPGVREQWMKMLREHGEIRNMEARLSRKDGSEYWGRISSRMFPDKGYIEGVLTDITEERKTVDALRESEERYRNLFDNAQIGIFRSRIEDGMIIECNQKAAEVYGYESREECIGDYKASEHYLDPGTRERYVKLLQENGEIDDYESRMKRKDYSEYWGRVSSRIFPDKGYIEGVMLDITEEKRAVEALKESEERYRNLFDNAQVGIFRTRIEDGMIIECNQKAAEIYGYASRDEAIGDYRASEHYLDPGVREWCLKVLRDHGEIRNFEARLSRKDGSEYWGRISSRMFPDKGYIEGVLSDITEERKTVEGLRESERKYRELADSLPQAVFEADAAGVVTFLNRKGFEMFGIDQEELEKGTITLETGVALDDKTRMNRHVQRVLDGAVLEDFEFIAQRRDGQTFPVAVHASPVIRDGIPVGIRGIVVDISERKRTEAELLKADKLESLGVLAGGIAHDFNNILAALIGNISVAKTEIDSQSPIFELLDQAEKASLRATHLTQQLLTFSKGGAPVKKIASVHEIIRESASFALRGSKALCVFHIADDLWPARIDVGQFNQVIHNLIINAQQAMPDGGIIDIEAENRSIEDVRDAPVRPGRYIRITVKDCGTGIPPEHIRKIFDPYFTTKKSGSGLGLATAYSIIKSHDGRIDVDSDTSRGTTFILYLPASPEEADSDKKEDRAPKSDPGSQGAAPLGRILVMDDEPMIRSVVGRMLERIGYSAETAKDGAEAFEKYETAMRTGQPFKAVILDLTVPGGMGGMETMEALLKIDPDVRAVVSSGYSTDPVMADWRKHGFLGFVHKPYTIEELDGVLDRLQTEKRTGV